MALKGLVNKLSDKLTETLSPKPTRGPWQPESGPYPLLMAMPDELVESLRGKCGVFALWHRGVRPQWIFVGFAADLAAALVIARDDQDVQKYHLNEGVYVAWTLLPVEECPGVVLHLRGRMQPALISGRLVSLGPIPDETPSTEFYLPVD